MSGQNNQIYYNLHLFVIWFYLEKKKGVDLSPQAVEVSRIGLLFPFYSLCYIFFPCAPLSKVQINFLVSFIFFHLSVKNWKDLII